jgi:hypothetical protein
MSTTPRTMTTNATFVTTSLRHVTAKKCPANGNLAPQNVQSHLTRHQFPPYTASPLQSHHPRLTFATNVGGNHPVHRHATILLAPKSAPLQNQYARNANGSLPARNQTHRLHRHHLTNANGNHAQKYAHRQNQSLTRVKPVSGNHHASLLRNHANGLHAPNGVHLLHQGSPKFGMVRFRRHALNTATVLLLSRLRHQSQSRNHVTPKGQAVQAAHPKSLKFGMVKFRHRSTYLRNLRHPKLPRSGMDKSKHHHRIGITDLPSEAIQKTTRGRG